MADHDARLWAQMLTHLRTHHPAICRQWFEDIVPLGLSGGILRLKVTPTLHRVYLRKECAAVFNEAAGAVTGRLVIVRFVGDADEPEEDYTRGLATQNGRGGEQTPAPRFGEVTINPDNNFENFVIGPGNRLAHAAGIGASEKLSQEVNPLFIYGGVGLGKTHLLQAICLRIMERHPGNVLLYISCEEFMTRYFASVQDGQLVAFRQKFRELDVLVIDDIHFLAKRERSQEEFFHTFNTLYQAGNQIILSSDAAPEVIPHLEQRLVSRFKQGMVAEVEPPDFETRVAIVRGKAQLRGIKLPEDVIFHVATCVDTNIRELEGAISTIQLRARVEGRAPDLAMARASVGSPAPKGSVLNIQVVISAVTDFYGVKLTDLQSKKRPQSVSLPRQVCMYLLRMNTRYSLEEIGGHFGGRDHTTVMHAVKAVEQRRKASPEFDMQVKQIQEQLSKPKML
jgi:chromosomal replication initiator protein